jgi:hypothetical protein
MNGAEISSPMFWRGQLPPVPALRATMLLLISGGEAGHGDFGCVSSVTACADARNEGIGPLLKRLMGLITLSSYNLIKNDNCA